MIIKSTLSPLTGSARYSCIFVLTARAFVLELGWRVSSLFSVGRRHVFPEQAQQTPGGGNCSIPIPVQKPMSWDHLGGAKASAQMLPRERETIQQVSVSSKMWRGAQLDKQSIVPFSKPA